MPAEGARWFDLCADELASDVTHVTEVDEFIRGTGDDPRATAGGGDQRPTAAGRR